MALDKYGMDRKKERKERSVYGWVNGSGDRREDRRKDRQTHG